MVCVLDSVSLRQHPLSNVIKIVDVDREPGDLSRADLCDPLRKGFQFLHGLLNVFIIKAAIEVDIEVDSTLLGGGSLWRARLNACHVDFIFSKNAESLVQDARFVLKREQDSRPILHVPQLNGVVWITFACHSISQITHAHHATELSVLGWKN